MKRPPPKPRVNLLQEARLRVAGIYSKLAARPIQRDCLRRTECCQFKITGRAPQITKGEALYLAHGVRAAGLRQLPTPYAEGVCPLLRPDGKCRAYEARPLGCRTHFCAEAGGPQSRAEVLDLIRELEKLDEELGGVGPRHIEAALSDELKRLAN